jgi:hypothetical protein
MSARVELFFNVQGHTEIEYKRVHKAGLVVLTTAA